MYKVLLIVLPLHYRKKEAMLLPLEINKEMRKIETKNCYSQNWSLNQFFKKKFYKFKRDVFILKEVFTDKNGFSPKNLNLKGESIFNEIGAVLPVSSHYYNAWLKQFTTSNFGEEVSFNVKRYGKIQVFEYLNDDSTTFYFYVNGEFYSHETSRSYTIVTKEDFQIGSSLAPGPL